MSEWQPIETAPIPQFDKEKWFAINFRCVVCVGSHVSIASYSYTEKGKGRWKDALGYNTYPTHWMPLPEPPK